MLLRRIFFCIVAPNFRVVAPLFHVVAPNILRFCASCVVAPHFSCCRVALFRIYSPPKQTIFSYSFYTVTSNKQNNTAWQCLDLDSSILRLLMGFLVLISLFDKNMLRRRHHTFHVAAPHFFYYYYFFFCIVAPNFRVVAPLFHVVAPNILRCCASCMCYCAAFLVLSCRTFSHCRAAKAKYLHISVIHSSKTK